MGLLEKLFGKRKEKNRKETYRREGLELEQEGKFEEAFLKYEKAAEMDDVPSMVYIARMYLSGNFRPAASSNLTELLLRGGPVFPWNLREEKQPDYQSGLEWLIKAGDLGSGPACETAGNMLCSGIGCQADMEKGIEYLEKAAANGQTSARKYICLYRPDGRKLTDEAYEACLTEFVKAVDSKNDKAYELYATLKSGTQKQLARLGRILIAAQNIRKAGYEPFRFSAGPSGIPLLPIVSKRGAWCTFLRFNMDAWQEKAPLIAVSSDILDVKNPLWLLQYLQHLEIVGTATYRSPAFGWLDERKEAVLIRFSGGTELDADAMNEVMESFALMDEEYKGDSSAFMVEVGEKEYSFEVAGINGDKVEVLWRYTIGGSSDVQECFEPELISMDIDL